MNVYYLLRLIDVGNESKIDGTNDMYNRSQRYVNVGLSIIDEEAKYSEEETILFLMLRKSNKKYEKIFG